MNFLHEVNHYLENRNGRYQRPIANIRKSPHIKRVSAISDDNKIIHFRLSETEIKNLAGEFRAMRRKGNTVSCEKRIEVFLCMMASGGFYRQIGHTLGLAKSTIFEHTHEVVDLNYVNWCKLRTVLLVYPSLEHKTIFLFNKAFFS